LKKWTVGLGIFLLGLALAILGRDGRALKKVENQRDDMLATGIKSQQDKAEKLNKVVERRKAGAKLAAAATVARLERQSANDPDMDDLLSHWQSARVRQQSD